MRENKKDILKGLTKREVYNQIRCGNVNKNMTVPTKNISTIILSNIFTIFNVLNLCLAFIIILTGRFKNLFFLGTVISNTVISIIQEVRAKREVDELSLMCEPKITVIRDSIECEIGTNDIVLGDIIKYRLGNQIVVDSIVILGDVEVNESFITGEDDCITKHEDDMLLSGSFVVAGNCYARVCHIKEENYSAKISKEAKYLKKVNSVLLNSLNKLIKILSWIIIPLGLLLFSNQYFGIHESLNDALVNTVAALVSMIPEGLVLLTSTVLMVSVINLSKKNVLVKQLYCIETLARVDTVCFDKTGTLTKGEMVVKGVIALNDEYDINSIMAGYCSCFDNDNATMKALKKYFCKGKSVKYDVDEVIPFSSSRKYSGIKMDNTTYVLGAPSFVTNLKMDLSMYNDYRVLMLVKKGCVDVIIGIILLEDKLRSDSYKTINYFKKQGVDIKIISGDNPNTIKRIVKKMGFDISKCVDCSNISDDELRAVACSYSIFGRVSPFQKRVIIRELKKCGKTVAMVGDGVNDVLALKEADCSIALACGSSAAYNVSDLVLLDSLFSSIPSIVLEGRKTINNVERSASLFISKTIYAVVLTLIFVIIPYQYPFIPIQLTLTNIFTIGIPSFLLALEDNNNVVRGDFFNNIIKKSWITSLVVVVCILVITFLNLNLAEKSTLSLYMLAFIGFVHIYRICIPINKKQILMITLLAVMFLSLVILLKDLFSLVKFNFRLWLIFIGLIFLSMSLFIFMDYLKVNHVKSSTKK